MTNSELEQMRSLIKEASGGDKWTMIGVVLTGVIALITGVWQIAKSFKKCRQLNPQWRLLLCEILMSPYEQH